MRLQTRLFLGAAALVLAMAAAQWFIVARQLRAVEREVGTVASSVGEELLTSPVLFVRGFSVNSTPPLTWVDAGGDSTAKSSPHIVKLPPPKPAKQGSEAGKQLIEVQVERDVKVGHEAGTREERRFLVVRSASGEARVRIPTSPVTGVVRRGRRESLLSSALVLAAGLLGAALMARRVSRPLRRLAAGADALARGEVGTQVEVMGTAEVADLEAAFNRMSAELARLEQERERWQAREHLAQLGELARGLAHTVRNPLNTLGLTVEELARAEGGDTRRTQLTSTARGEIQRIDRWMRSFLAVGAGDGAAAERIDADRVARDVVLEAVQRGAVLTLDVEPVPLPVRAVPAGLRAALANLVDNAVAACPAGPVRVTVERHGEQVVIRVVDGGEGLPPEVRERLFRPHTTTRPGGSGMGLYLARELVRADGGSLAVEDGEGCGTVATVRLPLAEGEDDVG